MPFPNLKSISKKTLVEWGTILSAFWFVRGVLAAFSLFSFIPNVVDFERYQALRAFHALIIKWNDAAAYIGSMIGKFLPFVPNVPASAINSVILLSVIVLPAIFELNKNGIFGFKPESRSDRMFLAYLSLKILMFGAAVIVSLVLWLDGTTKENVFLDKLFSEFLPFINMILITAFVFYLLSCLRGYLSGMYFSVGFVVSAELLYFAGTPGVFQWVNDVTDSALSHTLPCTSC